MTKPANKAYGLHLMIDAYGALPAKLDDIGLLFDTLGKRALAMTHLRAARKLYGRPAGA